MFIDCQSWLFTGTLPLYYLSPPSFCFDITCSDQSIMDDKNLHDYNVLERVETFIGAAIAQTEVYATNHIIMTMGSDFFDQNAHEDFKNLDKLIHYVNLQQENGSGINVFYSTPSCYLYVLSKAEKKWSTKTDDFFPYASTPSVYWTGYYTSRSVLKRYERYANNILQVTRQQNGFSQSNLRNPIFDLSEAMGLAQHHDSVSGTSKQHVANYYAQRISDGIDRAIEVINDAYGKLLSKENRTIPIPNQFLCHYSNIRACLPIEEQKQFTLTFWNSTIHPVTIYYRVPVTRQYFIYDPIGNLVSAEYLMIPDTTKNIPGRMNDNIGKEIIIRYNTDINSEKKYYTDGNERQVLERIRDYRPTWHYIPDDPISSNYYPINSRIWIRDQDRQLTILTDRSQGGGSICDGSIEIMVHRRILHDDSMGVKEALNETAYDKGLVVSGKHILLFDRPSDSARLHRTGAQQLFMHPLATYSLPNTSSYTNYSDMFRQSWSALSDAMPLNVHLLTFDQLAPKQYLVRVEHYFELNEDELYSK
ncbi:unnamed protein product, partial [Rotaria sp. Silwood2]